MRARKREQRSHEDSEECVSIFQTKIDDSEKDYKSKHNTT